MKESNMIKIEVLHCTGHGILPKLIGLFTASSITHSAIRIYENEEPFIYEMQKNGCTRKMQKSWEKVYGYHYKKTEHYISKFKYSKLKTFEGVLPYDEGTLIGSQSLYQLFGVWIGKKEKSIKDGVICSELVAYLLDVPEWWKQSPKSLYKWCSINNINNNV